MSSTDSSDDDWRGGAVGADSDDEGGESSRPCLFYTFLGLTIAAFILLVVVGTVLGLYASKHSFFLVGGTSEERPGDAILGPTVVGGRFYLVARFTVFIRDAVGASGVLMGHGGSAILFSPHYTNYSYPWAKAAPNPRISHWPFSGVRGRSLPTSHGHFEASHHQGPSRNGPFIEEFQTGRPRRWYLSDADIALFGRNSMGVYVGDIGVDLSIYNYPVTDQFTLDLNNSCDTRGIAEFQYVMENPMFSQSRVIPESQNFDAYTARVHFRCPGLQQELSYPVLSSPVVGS